MATETKTTKATKKATPAPQAAAPAPQAAAPAKHNAVQKMAALENAFIQQNQQIEILADEIDKLRQQIIILNKRINASIQASEEGGLNGESVNRIMMNDSIKELENKITYLVQQGVLVKNNDAEISEKTFVVGREVDAEGNVVNPRVQFAVGSVDKSLQDKLASKKAGAVIEHDANEPRLEIVEVYEITPPKKQQNFESPNA